MAFNAVRFVLTFGNESRLTSIPILTIDGEKSLSFASLTDKIKQKYSDNNNAEYKISCQLKQGHIIAILDDEDLYLAVESVQGFDGEVCSLNLSVKAEVVISNRNSTYVNDSLIDISASTTPIETAHIDTNTMIAVSHSEPSAVTTTGNGNSSKNHRNKRSRTDSLSNHSSNSSNSVSVRPYILLRIILFSSICLEHYPHSERWAVFGPFDTGVLTGERVAST